MDNKDKYEIEPIAIINTDFSSKFAIPRQPMLVSNISGKIIFNEKYATKEAVRGLEEFSHIWLIWGFSLNRRETWSPTIRPPRFGGNKRIGVFASRSPFRPNSLGLSCVKIVSINTDKGVEIDVVGADLVDGTPIYDIKPYIPFTDSYPLALAGYAQTPEKKLQVVLPEELLNVLDTNHLNALVSILELDPRPQYQHDEKRIYGFDFASHQIKFKVEGNILTVLEINRLSL